MLIVSRAALELPGKVNGGRIHGHFPDDLTSKGPLNVGRGRLIPTLGWESLWHGIAEWMGVKEEHTLTPTRTLTQTLTLIGW